MKQVWGTAARGNDYYIRGSALVGFADLVEAAGGDPAALLRKAGFSPKALTEIDSLISWSGLCILLELAAEELDKPSLGVEWALSIPDHFPNVGPIVLIAHFVDTFQEWIETSMRYWRYHTNAFTLQLLDDHASGEVAVRFFMDSPLLPSRQQTEYLLANTCRIARHLIGDPEQNPLLVRFQHARPSDVSLHEAVMRCPIEFEASYNEIVFARELLGRPMRGNLKVCKSVVDHYIRYRIRQMPIYDQTMATTVAQAIRSVVGTGMCSSEFVANLLGMSAKKLQRLLAREGTSFSVILEDVRHSMAVSLLSESNAPISRIAGLLDYSTIAPFTSAFKRWTGVSPRAFRKGAAQIEPTAPVFAPRFRSPRLVDQAS